MCMLQNVTYVNGACCLKSRCLFRTFLDCATTWIIWRGLVDCLDPVAVCHSVSMFCCRVKIIILFKGSGYQQFKKKLLTVRRICLKFWYKTGKFTICEECHWAMRHYADRRRLNGGHVTNVVENRG